MNKTIKYCILFFLVLLLTFSVWYHLPIHRSTSMTVCTVEGETAEVEIDISFQRYFFKPDRVKGTVVFNGIKYVEINSSAFANYFPEGSDFILDEAAEFGDQIRAKIQGEDAGMIFLKDSSSATSAYCNVIYILNTADKYDINKVDLMYLDEQLADENGMIHGVQYFGPAATQEEAEALYQDFYA